MKNLKLTKIISISLIMVSFFVLNPIRASAGWDRDGTKVWYKTGDSYYTGWHQIDGNWYYFDSNGYTAHDTYVDGYYLNSSGVLSSVQYSNNNTINSDVLGNQVADENCDEGHSISEVIGKWTSLKPIFNEQNIFQEQPYTKAPYKNGKVKDQYLADTLNYLNFARYLAYLKPVKLDSKLTTQAQYGAVLTTVNNKMEHNNPYKPIDMSDDFYERGQKSTSSSNLSGGRLYESIQYCLDDANNLMGYGNIGHREWLLDPKVTKIGFGTTSNYSAQNLPFHDFDDDVDKPDYLAWPSEGAFPNNLINRSAVWSINLNKDIYEMDDDVTVRITRLCDNKQWNLHEVSSLSTSTSGFKILSNKRNSYGFGADSNTIIFHIGTNDLPVGKYLGKYRVKVSGLNKDIEYTTNFFNLASIDLK